MGLECIDGVAGAARGVAAGRGLAGPGSLVAPERARAGGGRRARSSRGRHEAPSASSRSEGLHVSTRVENGSRAVYSSGRHEVRSLWKWRHDQHVRGREGGPEPSADAVSHHRVAHPTGDCVRDADPVGEERGGRRSVSVPRRTRRDARRSSTKESRPETRSIRLTAGRGRGGVGTSRSRGRLGSPCGGGSRGASPACERWVERCVSRLPPGRQATACRWFRNSRWG